MTTPRQALKKVAWTEAYSVGSPSLDAQHKKLIDMINALADGYSTLWSTTSAEKLAEILSDMFDYTSVHFQAEEALLKRIAFPDFPAHEAEHAEFVGKMALYCTQATNGVLDATGVHQYLKNWLVHHILQSDMQYRRHIEKTSG